MKRFLLALVLTVSTMLTINAQNETKTGSYPTVSAYITEAVRTLKKLEVCGILQSTTPLSEEDLSCMSSELENIKNSFYSYYNNPAFDTEIPGFVNDPIAIENLRTSSGFTGSGGDWVYLANCLAYAALLESMAYNYFINHGYTELRAKGAVAEFRTGNLRTCLHQAGYL